MSARWPVVTRGLAVCLTAWLATIAYATDAQTPRDGAGPALWQGTATLTGIVIEDADGRPVRRAAVTVQGSGSVASRSVVTDDNGRFIARQLPAGRYSVIARKAAYLDAAYGAKRPGRPGTAVHLDEAGTADVAIRMARGAVLEGMLRGETGDPLPGVTVYAFAPSDPGVMGPSPFSRQESTAVTDDRGVYRIYGVVPGEYIIASVFSPGGDGEIGRYADAAVDALLAQLGSAGRGQPMAGPPSPRPAAPTVGYAPTYFPGTTMFADASRVRVAAGDERRGLDFTLAPVATAVMEGTVIGDPQRLASVELSFVVDGPRTFMPGSRPMLSQRPGADGRFRYTSVPPGRYTIYARSSAPAMPGRGGASATLDPWFAAAEVAVFGQDARGLSLVLQPGVTVSGRVAFDATTLTPPDDLASIRVSLMRPGGGYMSNFGDGTVTGNTIVTPSSPRVLEDGRFDIVGVAPGGYELRGTIPTDVDGQWWLRSAMVDGRDLLDGLVEIRDQNLSDVVLTYSDRVNELGGRFQTASGLPATDYYVVAVPDDRALRQPGSRRMMSTRPDTNGTFALTRVPAGTYRLAALTDFDPSDLHDSVFVDTLAEQGIVVTVRDGERTVQDIRIAE